MADQLKALQERSVSQQRHAEAKKSAVIFNRSASTGQREN
jgi:hypothetical protein